jgi:hypothetical protein
MDTKVVITEISKLQLRPGDTLVIKTDYVDEWADVDFTGMLPDSCGILFLQRDTELVVLEKQEVK